MKVLIAIDNNFIRETYSEVFKTENFEVLETKKGKEALALSKEEKPDIVIADIALSEIGGFKLLKTLKEETSTEKIPVIIFAQFEKKEDRRKAMELEAKDFIAAASVSPVEVIRKVKIALGKQRSYRISMPKDLHDARELITDLGYSYDFKCPKCGSDLLLCLIRDLSKGEKYFILSVICPECNK
ncbi:response regulator [Patescibacteria group bacterium]|nr:response regulator [Patescibacteria group bacterium]